jgi:hypothetical protein
MKYLPFHDFEIHTTLTSDEVFYRLRSVVDTRRKWLIFTNKLFWGEVHRTYFRFWRNTWSSRNFTPIVSGKIQPEDSGCCVYIRMRMPWFGFWFYLLWLGAVWVMYFGGLANLVVQKIKTGIWEIESPWQLLPLIGMFAFGYFLSVGIFMSESQTVKESLLRLTEMNEENIKYHNHIFGVTEPQIIRMIFLVTLVVSSVWILYNLL